MMQPFFSIIIPTFNRYNLLHIAVKSVLNQSFTDWELIIVDDASSDNTKDLVIDINDSRVSYYLLEKSERSIARNFGIKVSTGKYICFVDDDDYIMEDHLLQFYNYYKNNNFDSIILRTGYYKQKKDTFLKSTNYNKAKHINPVRFAAFNMCGVWSLSIPKAFLYSDNFNAAFPHWQDTHLILRLFAKYSIKQLDTYTYVYRIHEDMGSKLTAKSGGNLFIAKLNISIDAIKHFFRNYHHLTDQYLPGYTERYLIAKKYYEFALYDLMYKGGQWFVLLLKRGLEIHYSWKFWKIYGVMIREFIKRQWR